MSKFLFNFCRYKYPKNSRQNSGSPGPLIKTESGGFCRRNLENDKTLKATKLIGVMVRNYWKWAA